MPRPHLSDHQKLAQARAEIARLRKVAGAKAEPLTDATRRKLEGELIKVKLENDRLREQLAAEFCASVVGRDRAPAPASQGAAGGDCRQAQARQACTAAARLLDVISVHRGTPDLRHADGPLRLRQGEGAKEGTQEDAQEATQEDTQEDARLTLLHRRSRRHDRDLCRLAAAVRANARHPSAARSSAACSPSRDRCTPVRCCCR